MAPNPPPKSPRMNAHSHSHAHAHPLPHSNERNHPVVPVTQPQEEIVIDYQPSDGNVQAVGGIEYHPLGKKAVVSKGKVRINEGKGEGVGWNQTNLHKGSTATSSPDRQMHSHSHSHSPEVGNVRDRGHGHEGHELSRQPHRDTQETAPIPLPAAMTAQHSRQPHPQHHHHHHSGPKASPQLHIQPPTPENTSPPPLQIRSLNTSNTQLGNGGHANPILEGIGRKYEGELRGSAQEGEGGGGGMMNRFKTTFLSKNKGPMSKTWARKSYLDELESMAPSSPRLHSASASAPVRPQGERGDLESGGGVGGGQGFRRITDQRDLPRARSVYASPIALAQFKALPPMNAQGEIMVAPR